MIFGLPVISVAIWLPIVFGILVLATGDDKNAPLARILALAGSLLGFLVTIPLYTGFVRDTSRRASSSSTRAHASPPAATTSSTRPAGARPPPGCRMT